MPHSANSWDQQKRYIDSMVELRPKVLAPVQKWRGTSSGKIYLRPCQWQNQLRKDSRQMKTSSNRVGSCKKLATHQSGLLVTTWSAQPNNKHHHETFSHLRRVIGPAGQLFLAPPHMVPRATAQTSPVPNLQLPWVSRYCPLSCGFKKDLRNARSHFMSAVCLPGRCTEAPDGASAADSYQLN